MLILNSTTSTHMQISASDVFLSGGVLSVQLTAVNSLRQSRVPHSCVQCGSGANRQRKCSDMQAFV